MKALILLITLLAQVAQAAPQKIDSYYIPMFHQEGGVDEETCEGEGSDGYIDWSCFLGAPARDHGYHFNLFSGDTAMTYSVSYKGNEIPWGQMWSKVKPSSGASHFYGPTNGVVEVRYYVDSSQREMKKVPFALIIRNDTERVTMDEDGNLVFTGTDEELIIIHLDKENSRAVAKVNARQRGANAKARKVADQLLTK